MSVKRTLKVYEILQIAMNPARAFVTHICKTLKNGIGFQATCKKKTDSTLLSILTELGNRVLRVCKRFLQFDPYRFGSQILPCGQGNGTKLM